VPWRGRVFVNPSYGRALKPCARKFASEAKDLRLKELVGRVADSDPARIIRTEKLSISFRRIPDIRYRHLRSDPSTTGQSWIYLAHLQKYRITIERRMHRFVDAVNDDILERRAEHVAVVIFEIKHFKNDVLHDPNCPDLFAAAIPAVSLAIPLSFFTEFVLHACRNSTQSRP